MRARLEAKLEELKAAHVQHQRQELERKYAVRYHKVSWQEAAGWLAGSARQWQACRARQGPGTAQLAGSGKHAGHQACRWAPTRRVAHTPGSHPQPPTPHQSQVRFFERIKLERRIKKLQTQLVVAKGPSAPAAATSAGTGAGGASTGNAASGDGIAAAAGSTAAQLEAALAAAKEDLEYVLYFPKAEKYVSILRQADSPEAQVGEPSTVRGTAGATGMPGDTHAWRHCPSPTLPRAADPAAGEAGR